MGGARSREPEYPSYSFTSLQSYSWRSSLVLQNDCFLNNYLVIINQFIPSLSKCLPEAEEGAGIWPLGLEGNFSGRLPCKSRLYKE